MRNKPYHITFHLPKIEGNRIRLSWEPAALFTDSEYWIEYAGMKEIQCQPDALMEAYLPVCLGLSFLGDVVIHLPVAVAPRVLQTWQKVCADTTRVFARRVARLEFVAPAQTEKPAAENEDLQETALLFGGGTESLLTLGRLLDQKIKPYLVSVWGPAWPGSNPTTNHDRYVLEEKLARDLGLRVIRIHTDFKKLYSKKNFKPYMRQKAYLVNAAMFLPINLAVVLPIVRYYTIGTIVSGNEAENSQAVETYSCSQGMTRNLRFPSRVATYRSFLEDVSKMNVIKELHSKHPQLATYQYSCCKSIDKRWCLHCEKCMRNYMGLKILDIDPRKVGIDTQEAERNLAALLFEIRRGILRSEVALAEWASIREEAVARGKQELVKTIDFITRRSFWSNIFSRKTRLH